MYTERTTTTISTGSLAELQEPGVDVLVGLAQHFDELVGLGCLAGREERVGCAGGASAACSSDAMHIVFRVVGVIKVDDKLHVVDVCAG